MKLKILQIHEFYDREICFEVLYLWDIHLRANFFAAWFIMNHMKDTRDFALITQCLACWPNNRQQGHKLSLMKILDPLAKSTSAMLSFLRFFLTLRTSLQYFKFLTWHFSLRALSSSSTSLLQGFILWLKIQSYSHEVIFSEFLQGFFTVCSHFWGK